MTDYILDVAKWRCGGDGPNRLGPGRTWMLSKEGFSCCLGQFAKQVGVDKTVLLNKSMPCYVASATGHIYDPSFVCDYRGLRNTPLATCLMVINDNEDTTPRTKIIKIRKELEAEGHTLTILNEDMLLP